MIRKLRRDMTIICALITGVILLFMSLVSLGISERQLAEQGQIAFQKQVNDIAYRIGTERTIEWSWLAQAEADSSMSLHLENNGVPLVYPGRALEGIEERDEMLEIVHTIAAGSLGVDIRRRPTSLLEPPKAFFGVKDYRIGVVVVRTLEGHISITAIGDTSQERAAIVRQRLTYLGLSAACILVLIWFSWWFSGRAVGPIVESRRQQSEFIAAASHELRTPLAVIGTSAAALSYEEGSRNMQFVQAIESECRRTGKLVDDLLTLANIDASGWSMEPGPVEVDALLKECVQAFAPAAEKKQQTLQIAGSAEHLPIIEGDEYRLHQAISILLDNAVYYTPEGGKIDAEAVRANQKYIRIGIADNGPGIPAENRAHVFERFYRAEASRTARGHYGLGLSIAGEIVRMHGGRIKLLETAGGGLTVHIYLPVMKAPH